MREMSFPPNFWEELVQDLTEGIVMEDEKGHIFYANPRLEEMLDYGPGELLGSYWKRIFPEEYISVVEEEFAKRPMGASSQYEAALLTKDGQRIPVMVSARNLARQDKFAGVLVVFTDITQSKTAEQETRRHLDELSALNRVALAVASATSLDEALERTTEALAEFLGYHDVAILLLDPQTQELHLHPSYRGQSREVVIYPLTVPAGRGITGWVVQNSEPALVPDISQDPRYVIGNPDTQSEMCAPLKVGEKTIGVINVESPVNGAFSQHDLDLLTTIASQVAILTENARLHEEQARRAQELEITAGRLAFLRSISQAVNSTLELDQILNISVDEIVQTFNVETAAIFLFDKEKGYAQIVAEHLIPGTPSAENIHIPLRDNPAFDKLAVTRQPLSIENDANDPMLISVRDILLARDAKSLLLVPLLVKGNIIGSIGLVSITRKRVFTADEIELAQTIANEIAFAIENARLFEGAKQLAITDALTGLYNLRYFYQELGKEIGRSDRYQRPLSLIMLDIDNFKKYNDAYGHLAGDDLLKELAQLAQGLVRKTDTLARYGGEEFFIILPETRPEEAHRLAQRIVDAVRETRFLVRDGTRRGQITISCGLATYPIHADNAKALIQAADFALYKAKKTKDGIWTFTPPTGQLPTPSKTTAQKVKATSKSQK